MLQAIHVCKPAQNQTSERAPCGFYSCQEIHSDTKFDVNECPKSDRCQEIVASSTMPSQNLWVKDFLTVRPRRWASSGRKRPWRPVLLPSNASHPTLCRQGRKVKDPGKLILRLATQEKSAMDMQGQKYECWLDWSGER